MPGAGLPPQATRAKGSLTLQGGVRPIAIFSGLLDKLSFGFSRHACLDDKALQSLRQAALDYLLARVPPAFRHGVEDGRIRLDVSVLDGMPCQAQLTLHMPPEEVAEGQRLLEADAAKQIMLASQGYAMPATPDISAVFLVDTASLSIPHKEVLQVAQLDKLRASAELLYATLSQARAKLTENPVNSVPWNQATRQRQIEACASHLIAADLTKACACRADGLAALLSERQMDYKEYVRSNPYAYAAAGDSGSASVELRVEKSCGLQRKPK